MGRKSLSPTHSAPKPLGSTLLPYPTIFPWIEEQGHSPLAWSVLGAIAQATKNLGLMTAVTCPTMRYHPAIIAQGAATLALLSDNRFTLGLGAGERLNEHVIGAG